jgi:membrane protease YdiL (CAAX protease family)
LELAAVTASIYAARRFLDRRSFESLGLRLDILALQDVLVGILIASIMMGGIYLALWSLGWLSFQDFAWQLEAGRTVAGQTVVFFTLFVMVGWTEELLSRGYHLQTIAGGLNTFWGVLLSSVIFGGLHLSNPNASPVAAAGIFFAGVFLAYACLRTGQLWLSIGLHIGWNFFEGVVFGFPVSGLSIYHLLRITVTGPSDWTGGAFGPEAGLIVLPALGLGAGLIRLYGRLRRRPV